MMLTADGTELTEWPAPKAARHGLAWWQPLAGGLLAGCFGLAVLGLVASVGAKHAPVAPLLREALGFAIRPAVFEGVIVDLQVDGSAAALQMTTMDGRDHRLQLHMQNTGVFVPGAVLNPGHLRPGQRIEASVSLQGRRAVARAIRIINGP